MQRKEGRSSIIPLGTKERLFIYNLQINVSVTSRRTSSDQSYEEAKIKSPSVMFYCLVLRIHSSVESVESVELE